MSAAHVVIKVNFLRSGLVVEWDDSMTSLLELAESHGLSPSFCCRAGVCGTCVSRLVRGAIEYVTEPVCELYAGEILLCCSRPIESMEIDI